MKCGLVILNYNDFPTTQNLLDAVKDFPEIDHIAVVDNNSPNESYEVLKKYEGGKITVIQSGRNGGYSFGNNIGIKYLIRNHQPDIIGIANPDTMFTDSFVKRIKELFIANQDYAVITGLQLNVLGDVGGHPFWEENEGRASFLLKQLLLKSILMKPVVFFQEIFRCEYTDKYRAYRDRIRNSPNVLNQVWAVEGSLFFIRTKDFERISLFDERIFMGYEESVLAGKLKALGRKIGVANDITYIHDHKNPKPEKISLSLTLFEESTVFYYSNYPSENKMLRFLLVFLIRARKLRLLFENAIKSTIKRIIS